MSQTFLYIFFLFYILYRDFFGVVPREQGFPFSEVTQPSAAPRGLETFGPVTALSKVGRL
jgi:hypothetical protein